MSGEALPQFLVVLPHEIDLPALLHAFGLPIETTPSSGAFITFNSQRFILRGISYTQQSSLSASLICSSGDVLLFVFDLAYAYSLDQAQASVSYIPSFAPVTFVAISHISGPRNIRDDGIDHLCASTTMHVYRAYRSDELALLKNALAAVQVTRLSSEAGVVKTIQYLLLEFINRTIRQSYNNRDEAMRRIEAFAGPLATKFAAVVLGRYPFPQDGKLDERLRYITDHFLTTLLSVNRARISYDEKAGERVGGINIHVSFPISLLSALPPEPAATGSVPGLTIEGMVSALVESLLQHIMNLTSKGLCRTVSVSVDHANKTLLVIVK